LPALRWWLSKPIQAAFPSSSQGKAGFPHKLSFNHRSGADVELSWVTTEDGHVQRVIWSMHLSLLTRNRIEMTGLVIIERWLKFSEINPALCMWSKQEFILDLEVQQVQCYPFLALSLERF